MPFVEAFGERKPIIEWSRDPRCVVKYGTLVQRLDEEWPAADALTQPAERKERKYSRPPVTIEAFGDRKTISEWKDDGRVLVKPNVFIRRIQHGWTPEAAFTTPLSVNRGRREGNGPTYEIFGESKTIREWAQDERCSVSEMTLRKNLQSGMPLLEAFQFRRRPGRNLGAGKEEVGREVDDLSAILGMMNDGGELWVYDTGGSRRISLIYKDIRNILSEEIFAEMTQRGIVEKSFETDTIKNFVLSPVGETANR
ncbi:MAG: hypothetical protein P4L46_21210 [Fimbriimonas sp.]|nr:hypothetical protein [Fimbriimonas sp.]